MDQIKIGKFIATCRKKQNMTQSELANRLSVSDKSVSKWENGICLPNPSLYMELCDLLGITLNDLFHGEIIEEESFKKTADQNLLEALEQSSFTVRERMDYFEKKWKKEHRTTYVFGISLWLIVILLLRWNGYTYMIGAIGGILGVLLYVVIHQRMMMYVEHEVFDQQNKKSQL